MHTIVHGALYIHYTCVQCHGKTDLRRAKGGGRTLQNSIRLARAVCRYETVRGLLTVLTAHTSLTAHHLMTHRLLLTLPTLPTVPAGQSGAVLPSSLAAPPFYAEAPSHSAVTYDGQWWLSHMTWSEARSTKERHARCCMAGTGATGNTHSVLHGCGRDAMRSAWRRARELGEGQEMLCGDLAGWPCVVGLDPSGLSRRVAIRLKKLKQRRREADERYRDRTVRCARERCAVHMQRASHVVCRLHWRRELGHKSLEVCPSPIVGPRWER